MRMITVLHCCVKLIKLKFQFSIKLSTNRKILFFELTSVSWSCFFLFSLLPDLLWNCALVCGVLLFSSSCRCFSVPFPSPGPFSRLTHLHLIPSSMCLCIVFVLPHVFCQFVLWCHPLFPTCVISGTVSSCLPAVCFGFLYPGVFTDLHFAFGCSLFLPFFVATFFFCPCHSSFILSGFLRFCSSYPASQVLSCVWVLALLSKP